MRLLLVCCVAALVALCLTTPLWAAPYPLSSFETDADLALWNSDRHKVMCPDPCVHHDGTLARSASYATDGAYALQMDMLGSL